MSVAKIGFHPLFYVVFVSFASIPQAQALEWIDISKEFVMNQRNWTIFKALADIQNPYSNVVYLHKDSFILFSISLFADLNI